MEELTLPHFHDNLHGACLADPSFPVLQAIQRPIGSGCKKREGALGTGVLGAGWDVLPLLKHHWAGPSSPWVAQGRSQFSPGRSQLSLGRSLSSLDTARQIPASSRHHRRGPRSPQALPRRSLFSPGTAGQISALPRHHQAGLHCLQVPLCRSQLCPGRSTLSLGNAGHVLTVPGYHKEPGRNMAPPDTTSHS